LGRFLTGVARLKQAGNRVVSSPFLWTGTPVRSFAAGLRIGHSSRVGDFLGGKIFSFD
jgi:hypothetical protein